MLDQALTALAAAGGTAVVQAAGTDMWTELRQQLARVFGRGNAEAERNELELLDQTAVALRTANEADATDVRSGLENQWRGRFLNLLAGLEATEQHEVVRQLSSALASVEGSHGAAGTVSHNTFHGPTAFQTGPHAKMENHFK
ncbi:hypothetical protein [Streptomyces sp. NPDC020681]|uniref:hypothetical protein n=1 Tax=Streptomyces sp. NPDC020681 TaxID=3365083 RepID=UPI003797CE5A